MSGGVRIQVLGLADGTPAPVQCWFAWVDVEANDGHGDWVMTKDPDQAALWPDVASAHEAWRAVPRSRPVRADGLPNRPLTAFTISLDYD